MIFCSLQSVQSVVSVESPASSQHSEEQIVISIVVRVTYILLNVTFKVPKHRFLKTLIWQKAQHLLKASCAWTQEKTVIFL